MSARLSFRNSALCGLALTAATGCSPGPEYAEVRGVVTLGGRPLPNVRVTFVAEQPALGNGSPLPSAVTDTAGAYRLTHNDQSPGVATGSHRVTVEDEVAGMQRIGGSRESQDEQPLDVQPPGSRVPQAFWNAATSPLVHEVKPGENVINLPLSP